MFACLPVSPSLSLCLCLCLPVGRSVGLSSVSVWLSLPICLCLPAPLFLSSSSSSLSVSLCRALSLCRVQPSYQYSLFYQLGKSETRLAASVLIKSQIHRTEYNCGSYSMKYLLCSLCTTLLWLCPVSLFRTRTGTCPCSESPWCNTQRC